MQNSMVVFTFSVLDRKYPFRTNLVNLGDLTPKFKTVCSKWNLVPRLIRICRIQWQFSFFQVLTRNTLFGQMWYKKPKSPVWAEMSLRKIPYFHLISWCGNFARNYVETVPFHKIEEVRRNCSIFRSVW